MCVISRLISRLAPRKRRRQSKRGEIPGKRRSKRSRVVSDAASGGGKRKSSPKYTRVSKEERDLVLELRSSGLSIHAIATELDRSSRTIHLIINEHGMASTDYGADEENLETPDAGGDENRVRRRKSQPMSHDDFLERISPTLLDRLPGFIEEHPEVLEQFIYKSAGLRPPGHSLDDEIRREIASFPELRRRLAENWLMQKERQGRTELQIVEEGLNMLIRLAELTHRGDWAKAAKSLAESGELSKTAIGLIEGLRGLRSQTAPEPGIDRTLPTEVVKKKVQSPPHVSARDKSRILETVLRNPMPRLSSEGVPLDDNEPEHGDGGANETKERGTAESHAGSRLPRKSQ